MAMMIPIEVLEAVQRILDPSVNSYPDLKFTGSEESMKKFHDDVTMVCEWVAELVTSSGAAA